MASRTTREPLALQPSPTPGRPLPRLVCIPGAGSSALMYAPWRRAFAGAIEIVPLEPPGRGRRLREPTCTTMRELVEDLERAVMKLGDLRARPLAFFGHSMGALVAFELIETLRRKHGVETTHAFMSARNPPNVKQWLDVSTLSDKELGDLVQSWGGVPDELRANSSFMATFLPVLRSDFGLVRAYLQRPGSHHLSCPLAILAAHDDSLVQVDALPGWEGFTSRSCSFHAFRGGHAYLGPRFEDVRSVIETKLLGSLPAQRTMTAPKWGLPSVDATSEIAVIGMSGRFPGASDVASFWRNLRTGVDSISRFPRADLECEAGTHPPARGVLADLEGFDAAFFEYSAREARSLDPQFRLLHECVWEALEDAGYVPGTHEQPVGLYAGAALNESWMLRMFAERMAGEAETLEMAPLTLPDELCTLVSSKLGLTGPSVTVQAACATSLVAIHQAVRALRAGQCAIAIAGGVSVQLPSKVGSCRRGGTLDSPDGRCRPFDAAATGTVFGDAAGVVALKRLSDALADRDHVYAVIRGSATNHDGHRKVGYTAPSPQGQAAVIRAALDAAAVSSESISYVEAHGAGTLSGDAVEVEALTEAYRADARAYCGIGSVKSNIGHVNAAAGVAGFIKAALALHHHEIPPTLHYASANPRIDFASSPFEVVTSLREWPTGVEPRRAGVSSFGLGGMNAHVILEEAPAPRSRATTDSRAELVLLSAKTESALREAEVRLARQLRAEPSLALADVAYTLQVGRASFAHRRAFTCRSVDEAVQLLESPARTAPQRSALVFCLPARPSASPSLVKALYEREPAFRRAIEACVTLASGHGRTDLTTAILGGHDDDRVATFATLHALASMLEAWGVVPDVVVGEGPGELTAACLAGAVSLEDAVHMLTTGTERADATFAVPHRRWISSATGDPITTTSEWNAWRRRFSEPVASGAAQRLASRLGFALLVGAGDAGEGGRSLLPDIPDSDERTHLLRALGAAWETGAAVRFGALATKGFLATKGALPGRVSLPTYPFQRKRHWPDGPAVRLVLDASSEETLTIADLDILVRETWAKILGKEPEADDDNFFESGGDSLKAMRFASQLQNVSRAAIRVRDVFAFPTPSRLAAELRRRADTGARESQPSLLVRSPIKAEYAVSSSQQRMYLLQRILGQQTAYNSTAALEVRGRIDEARMEAALHALVERHEMLRTTFHFSGEAPTQRIHPSAPIAIEHFASDDAGIEAVVCAFVRPFDVAKGPLLRVALVRIENERHLLLLDLHNIVADATALNVLVKEFCALYEGRSLPPLAIQYKDFAEWQAASLASDWMRTQERYWLGMFDDIPRLAMPLDCERGREREFGGKTIDQKLSIVESRAVRRLAKDLGVTLNTVFYALQLTLLHLYSEQTDIVLGSLVEGRRQPETEGIIGTFTNFLPVRNHIDPKASFADLLATTQRRLLEAYDHQDYPFDRLVEKLSTRIERDRNPLYDSMVIFHNESDPSTKFQIDDLVFDHYRLGQATSKLDMKLDVVLNSDETFTCVLQFNDGLYHDDSIDRMVKHFVATLREVSADPQRPLDTLSVIAPDDRARLREKRGVTKSRVTERVALHATFTADPLVPVVAFWSSTFALDLDVRVGAYNQVFQTLLRTTKGADIDVVLVRFEDWLRDSELADAECIEHLSRSFDDLVGALRDRRAGTPCLVGVLPSGGGNLSANVCEAIRALTDRWLEAARATPHVHALDLRGLATTFAVPTVFDAVSDRDAHLPFSDAFYAALGTAIARALVALRRPPLKVLVVDCDNTLWRGVVGEDGPSGVVIDAGRASLHRFLRARRDEGVLLALASKNEEADVWAAFEHLGLARSDFTTSRINWRPKSENLRAMATDLNVGLDSFAIIDDSGAECAELMANVPEVLTMQLPAVESEIPLFLEHVWAFDKLRVTSEDRQRHEMYLAERARKEARGVATDQAFLAGLDLHLTFRPLSDEQIPRAAQLTQRTNQFNLSTIRRNEDDVRRFLADPHRRCWTVDVRDRFGSYGTSGLVMAEHRAGALFMETFLLSCRVLGRGVETAVMEAIGRYCRVNAITHVTTSYVPTEKNGLVRAWLDSAGWILVDETAQARSYTIDVEALSDRGHHVAIHDRAPFPEAAAAPSPAPMRTQTDDVPIAETPTRGLSWRMHVSDEERLRHRAYYAPLMRPTAAEVQAAVRAAAPVKVASTAYVAPTTALEKTLCAAWASVLSLPKVGVNDDFFQLGGDSLSSLRVVWQTQKANLTVTPRDISNHPTPARLAAHLAGAGGATRTPDEQGLVHGPVPFTPNQHVGAKTHDPEGHIWNLTHFVKVPPGMSSDALRTAAEALLAHHDGLRIQYLLDEEGNYYWTLPQVSPGSPYEYIDCRGVGQDSLRAFIEQNAERVQHSFTGHGSRMRLAYFDLGPESEGRLLFVVHHMVSDHISTEVLRQDLMTAYTQVLSGVAVTLPRKTTSFKRWAERLVEYSGAPEIVAQQSYWTASPRDKVLPLPVEKPGGKHLGSSRRRVSAKLGPDETRRFSAAAKGTLGSALQVAAFGMAVGNWSGRRLVLLDLIVNGRNHPFDDIDLSRTVGWFATTYPFLVNLEQAADDRESILDRVTRDMESVPLGGFGYGLLRHLSKDEDIKRRLAALPLPTIHFNYDPGTKEPDAAEIEGEGDGERQEVVPASFPPAPEFAGRDHSLLVECQHAMYVGTTFTQDGYAIDIGYSDLMYFEASIQGLADDYLACLVKLLDDVTRVTRLTR